MTVQPAPRAHIVGFDYLRLAAISIITAQHGLSVIGHYDWTQVAPGCTLGQFGVAIFCALAGHFAVNDRQSPGRWPGAWITARLVRLFPAYWVATVLAFALAMLMGRPVTVGLFVSQVLGLGYFTHGMALVNVVSWFISLILLCYGLTVVAWLSPWPRHCLAAFSLCALALAISGIESDLARHVLAFTTAASIAGSGRRWPGLAAGTVIVVAGVAIAPALLVSGIALLAVWLFQLRFWPSARPVETVAAYIYEYFLLHGLFLQAGVKALGPTAAGLLLGVIASAPAVIALKRFADAVAAPKPVGKPPPG